MSTSPWPPAAGAAPDPAPAAPPEGAVADGATAPAAASAAPTSEQHPVKEGGDAAATAAVQQQQEEEEEETKPQLLCEDDSEADQEHEQKINKYQAILAARLKDKYFSNKAFDGGDVFEAEIIVDGEIIQSSMWPCTSSFANPINIFREKSNHERNDSPSLTADSSAKNNSPRTDSSPKNSASALATENNLTPGKRQPSKKT